jgi:RHS repeat-associated protein
MGNITSLNRDGTDYAYSYTGNRLKQVTGLTSSDYGYDVNGNATFDARNNKTITYNLLNLPQTVSGGISYLYDATGTKLRKTSATTTDYVKGIEYENNQITIIHTEEGVARRSGTSYNYEYNLKDHLGNVRYTFYRNPNTGQIERLQSDDYYAFGLRKSGQPVSLNNKYLYNGKELQDETGFLDYGARQYDPLIGRWLVIDPMAEMYQSLSPYNYAMNDPVGKLDPNGMWVETANGWTTNNQDEIAAALNSLQGGGDDPKKKKKKEEGSIAVNTPGKGIKKKSDGSYSVFDTKSSEDDGVADAVSGMVVGLSPLGVGMDAYTLFSGEDYGSGEEVSWGWRAAGMLPFVSEFKKLQRLHHIFGKAEHALEPLVKKFGSQEKALEAIQNAANKALKDNKLNIGNNGILPTGNNGNIINVGGMDVRIIGGRVSNGNVTISSVSRKGL